jgi:hypothetical protein
MRSFQRIVSFLALIGCGCAHRGPAPAPFEPGSTTPGGQGVIVTPDNTVVGKVISVDGPGGFVVLNFPLGRMPESQRRYHLYRRGLKVAEVWISGPQTGENTVADILTGEAAVGDEARPR